MGFIDKFRRYCGGSLELAWLLTATVGISLLLWVAGAVCHLAGQSDAWISNWLALSADPIRALTRPWTLITYIVTHLNPLHLLFNSLWLYWFGLMISDIGRDRSMLWLFLGGGVVGGLLYLLTAVLSGYNPGAFLTGDSAAVLSVMTAVAILIPNRSLRLFLLGEIKVKWIAIICIVITLIGANGSGVPPQAAHFGGIAFGLALALHYKGTLRISFPRNKKKSVAPRRHNVKATLRAIDKSLNDEERLDALLDKIRVSGYDSLSNREKTELNHISSRLDNPKQKELK